MSMKLGGLIAFLLVVTAAPVLAAPPATSVWDYTTVGCTFEGDFGVADFWAEVFGPDEGYADVAIWLAEGGMPYEDIPDIVGDWESISFSFDGSALFVHLPLVDYDFTEPKGTAVLDGVLEPAGETEVFEDRFRDGNRWVEIHEEYTPLMATGLFEIALFGSEAEMFDLTGCWAQMVHVEEWSTNPNAYVADWEGTEMYCALESEGYYAELFGFTEEWGGYLDLIVWGPGSEPWMDDPLYWGGTEAIIEPGTFYQEFELWSPFEEEPVGTAAIDATLERGDRESFVVQWQGGRDKVVLRLLDVSGTLSTPDVEFDLASCEAYDYRDKVIFTNPRGPKPVGKAPANDLPDGAFSLEARGTTNAQTKATAPAPEAECIMTWDGEEWGIPLGKTLWYTLEGTGEAMTVDTAGSNFDTVLGIYTFDGMEFAQVACVDDVGLEFGYSLQAAATFDTDDGTTYYVQVGGFDGQFGHVRLNTN
jgi:hypothetical protein